MSKIGKKPIIIPEGVEIKLANGFFEIKGKLGNLNIKLLDHVLVEIKSRGIQLNIKRNNKQARANWGTMAALLKNAILGVTEGFSKILEIEGIGHNASMEGNVLVLKVGFTRPVKFVLPEGVKIKVEKNVIKVLGIDKALVGEAAAQIRRIKKPEPYKGTGIRYQGEIIHRKAGKKVAGAGTASAAA